MEDGMEGARGGWGREQGEGGEQEEGVRKR